MRLQLIVTYYDHQIMYYQLDSTLGWKIDNASRCIIIGKGVPRIWVPLDTVRSFEISEVGT